ncbi:MAG: sigma-70 family RNA polymerase sigma factor [Chloroflexota bacterium]|nr:sigma-70 family RNA polymerase sigma factor [Chloroflexota bacterium]
MFDSPRADVTPADDDARLVVRIRAGDREALGELYDRYARQAMAVAVRFTRDRSAAEDVVHDVFVVVWEKIDRFDASRGSIRTWLLTVVRNRALDRLRSAPVRLGGGEPNEGDAVTDPGHTWDAVEGRLSTAELRGAIERLPAEQREAIELAYFRGRTYREIAEMTGVPHGTASGRLRLALRKLRESLAWTDAAPLPVPIESGGEVGFHRNREGVR